MQTHEEFSADEFPEIPLEGHSLAEFSSEVEPTYCACCSGRLLKGFCFECDEQSEAIDEGHSNSSWFWTGSVVVLFLIATAAALGVVEQPQDTSVSRFMPDSVIRVADNSAIVCLPEVELDPGAGLPVAGFQEIDPIPGMRCFQN